MKSKTWMTGTALTAVMLMGSAQAHDGRRFDIQIKDGQLVALGYISGNNPVDDGNGVVRDYYNAIHSHWTDLVDLGIQSRSTLPGFDISDESDLIGDELWLTVTGVKKWAHAPFSDFAGSHGGGHGSGHGTTHTPSHGGGHFSPNFAAIPADEWVQVQFNGAVLNLGNALQIESSVGSQGHYDLTFDYKAGNPLDAALAPETAVYLVELQLSTSDPSILPSDTIYAILSPTIAGAHGLSLATEQALGTPVPEPASLAIMALLPVLMRRRA